MYVCMHVGMYVCMHVCMCVYVTYAWLHMHVSKICTHVRMYVHVCMHVCVYMCANNLLSLATGFKNWHFGLPVLEICL
jgi:hypothetical protein